MYTIWPKGDAWRFLAWPFLELKPHVMGKVEFSAVTFCGIIHLTSRRASFKEGLEGDAMSLCL